MRQITKDKMKTVSTHEAQAEHYARQGVVPVPEDLTKMSLSELARIIRGNWKPKVYFGAVPYLDAMGLLEKITDTYGCDSGREIVMYFLSNATTWKGDVARCVKAELNRRLKEK